MNRDMCRPQFLDASQVKPNECKVLGIKWNSSADNLINNNNNNNSNNNNNNNNSNNNNNNNNN